MGIIFGKISKIPQVARLIADHKILRRWFCGAHHFQSGRLTIVSAQMNKGRSLTVIKAAETRMAGYFYALHRDLRLKSTYEAIVVSAPYIEKEKNKELKNDRAKPIVQNPVWFTRVYLLLRAVWPLLRLLRMGDLNCPAMGFVYHRTMQAEAALSKSKGDPEIGKLNFEVQYMDSSDESENEEDTEADSGSDSSDENGHGESQAASVIGQIEAIFEKYKHELLHAYAKAGYLLEPSLVGVSKNAPADVHDAFRGVARRLLYNKYSTVAGPGGKSQMDLAIAAVDTALLQFSNQMPNTPFQPRAPCWQNEKLISSGKGFEWHYMYTAKMDSDEKGQATEQYHDLAWVAGHVLSKLIGAGGAERNWKDVKRVWDSSKSRMGSTKAEKRVIVYTAKNVTDGNAMGIEHGNVLTEWTAEDEGFDLQLNKWGVAIDLDAGGQQGPVRRIPNYMEDWEGSYSQTLSDSDRGALKKRTHGPSKFRLLEKYANIKFFDDEADGQEAGAGAIFQIDPDQLHWVAGRGGGHHVLGNQLTNLTAADATKRSAGQIIEAQPYAINGILHQMIKAASDMGEQTAGVELVPEPGALREAPTVPYPGK